MKQFLFIILLLVSYYAVTAQFRIHSHNDYQQAEPLLHALRNKVYSLEADVYPTDSGLVVAHDKKDIATGHLLEKQYLQPIIFLFNRYKGRISQSKTYSPVLMIDIKEKGAAVLAALIKLVAAHRNVFDRSVNAMAVQLVISGDRTAVSAWTSYPSYIYFDGRPAEVYDSATLQGVAFISDNYNNYINEKDSTNRLLPLINKVHSIGKLLRLWGTPDNAVGWKMLHEMGVDIINTDSVEKCRKFFER